MTIAILDAATLGEDISLSPIASLGETRIYPSTPPALIRERLMGVEVAVVNKVKLGRESLEGTGVRLICLAATGYDNVDIGYCREAGIAVCNVLGYSTDSVAEVTLAMVFSLVTRLREYEAYLTEGDYVGGETANRVHPPYHELSRMTFGIIGYGNIGQKVGAVARAMGARVLPYSRTLEREGRASLDTLLRESDVITLHTPLNDESRALIDDKALAKMKPSAILVNVARGAVTDESAVARAMLEGRLGGLGCDVYSTEPMPKDHPYTPLIGHPRVILTPHMAWASYEARVRCIAEIAENILSFAANGRRSRVD